MLSNVVGPRRCKIMGNMPIKWQVNLFYSELFTCS